MHEIKKGADWQDSLNWAVRSCHVFVPLVTPRYGETLWTNREVSKYFTPRKVEFPFLVQGQTS